MKLLPFQKIIIKSPLDKKNINEILVNSIGVEGPETKRKFVSGVVKDDYFRIRVEAKNWSDVKGYLNLNGKVISIDSGAKVELDMTLEMFPVIAALMIIFGSLGLFYFIKGVLAHNFGVETFSFVFVGVIYLFVMMDYNSEVYAIKEELLRLVKGSV
jgi:hypothetical protein